MALLLTRGARAEEPSAHDAAKMHYEAGSLDYQRGDYAAACEEFHRSYAIAPAPGLLYNLGRCAEKLGRLQEALDAYQRYQAVSPDPTIEARIEQLRASIDAAQPVPAVEVAVPAASVMVPPPVPLPLPPPSRKPIYKRAALWAPLGAVVVVGLAVGLGVGLTRSHDPRFPTLDAR